MNRLIGILIIGLGVIGYMVRKEYAEFTYKRQEKLRKGQIDHDKWVRTSTKVFTFISLLFVVIGSLYAFAS